MGKYQPLAEWVERSGVDRITLTFAEIERTLGFALPDSARQYAAYWQMHAPNRDLLAAGWKGRLRPATGSVEFSRLTARTAQPAAPAVQAAVVETPAVTTPATEGRPDLVLIGCVKQKRPGRTAAKDLYTSPLFLRRRRYAESIGAPWFIVSAKLGLAGPDDAVDSYELAIADLSAGDRQAWSEQVLRAIDSRFGSVAGKVVELHAGKEYRDSGLAAGLRARGATVRVPLHNLGIGEQLQWYDRFRRPAPAAADGSAPAEPTNAVGPARRGPLLRSTLPSTQRPDAAAPIGNLARLLSEDFDAGRLDLSARPGAPVPGWAGMPEFVAVERLKELGADGPAIRLFLTFVAALDRARDADRLWRAAIRLFESDSWTFDPAEVCQRPLGALSAALRASGVSQRHGSDAAAWRLIAESLVSLECPGEVRRAIFDGRAGATELLREVVRLRPDGSAWFPMLQGPKVSVMWVRLLAAPGGAGIDNLGVLPVAVDVQVRKVTEYLGVTQTTGQTLEAVRSVIQAAWQAMTADAAGPPALAGTGAALDPALWFFAKWGCSFCERANRRLPIGRACVACRFGE